MEAWIYSCLTGVLESETLTAERVASQFEFLTCFSSGFVSTNPEPRCVTIQKIRTDPVPRSEISCKWPRRARKLTMNFHGGEGESVTNFAVRSFALGLAIMAALVSALSAAGQGRDLQKVFATGQAELQQETWMRRNVIFGPCSRRIQSGPAYTNLGVIAMRRKKWDEALGFLKKAARLQPNEPGIG